MTISINKILHFDVLSVEMATRILYEHLVPICEKEGVKLSFYGNHASSESIYSIERNKKEEYLFNVERTQRAFSCLGDITTGTYEAVESNILKCIIETYQKDYITNGDCIAAMLLKGYVDHFRSEYRKLSCRFNLSPNR